MSSTEATPHETTRIYARQPAPPPPSEPQDKGKHYGYNIDSSPRPPPPPPRPQLGLKAPPAPLEHMGWNRAHWERIRCQYLYLCTSKASKLSTWRGRHRAESAA